MDGKLVLGQQSNQHPQPVSRRTSAEFGKQVEAVIARATCAEELAGIDCLFIPRRYALVHQNTAAGH